MEEISWLDKFDLWLDLCQTLPRELARAIVFGPRPDPKPKLPPAYQEAFQILRQEGWPE